MERGKSGEEIVPVQQRLTDLGYIHFRATGLYGDMTYEGVADFQERNGLRVDGIIGESTLEKIFAPQAKRAAINPRIIRTVGPGALELPEEYGKLSNWQTVNQLFPVGETVRVRDFNTNRTWQMKRTGGENHADVQPVSQEDADELLKCFGGAYTWEKRAMLVEIQGELYAASLFGMPDSGDGVENIGTNGSFCLYFWESQSDVAGLSDAEHDAMIKKAANQ